MNNEITINSANILLLRLLSRRDMISVEKAITRI